MRSKENSSTIKGSVKRGIAYQSTFETLANKDDQRNEELQKFIREKEQNWHKIIDNDIFGIAKKHTMGPGFYDVNDDILYRNAPKISMEKTGRN